MFLVQMCMKPGQYDVNYTYKFEFKSESYRFPQFNNVLGKYEE